MAIRQDGDWEGWLRFFLTGVKQTAEEAVQTARSIVELRERHQAIAADAVGVNGAKTLECLFRRPLINVNVLADELGVTFATANRVIDGLQRAGIVEEITGGRRNRVFPLRALPRTLRGRRRHPRDRTGAGHGSVRPHPIARRRARTCAGLHLPPLHRSSGGRILSSMGRSLL
jgi:ribosomal protein S25